MLLALVLMFAIGWTASSGSLGIMSVFVLLLVVELYRRGRDVLKAQQEARVNRITGR